MDVLNYSVKPMIENFNFEEFLNKNITSKRKLAFLLITANQLLYGYTKNYGTGSHDGSLSNAVRDIYDMPLIETEGEQYRICEDIKENFISAHFANEPDIGVYLAFYLHRLKSISPSELALFEQFYDECNDIISDFSRAYGHPLVTAVLPDLDEPVIDEFGFESRMNTITSNDMTELLKYLRKIVDPNKKVQVDKRIIGESLKTKKR